jgi:hypothetical protein
MQIFDDDGFGGVVSGEICMRLVLIFLLSLGKDLMCPGDAWSVEVAPWLWNKLLLAFLHIAVMVSGGGSGPVSWEPVRIWRSSGFFGLRRFFFWCSELGCGSSTL